MRQRILWNHKWAFTKMADSAPVTLPGKWDFVNIPHTWNGIDGQDGDNDYYRGKTFTIKAKGNSEKNIYIQKMWLNGREWHSTRIPFSAIVNGGELVYQMGAEPNYEWFEE